MGETGPNRIVITGTGLACGLGTDVDTAWQNVLAGRRGIRPMSAMESALPPGSDGGQAVDLPADFSPELPRESRYLRWAITHAIAQAGTLPYAPQRVSVMLGTTLHGMRAAGRFLRSDNADELKNFLAGDIVARATDGLNLHGGHATTCSACSSGLGAIALAMTLLNSGAADAVIAGGYDPVSEYAWAGFNALRLISGPPLRPFARGRLGMKIAEAYAVVVLERASDAQRRGARAIAVVSGFGETADAHHLTQPHPAGIGAAAAMHRAIAEAGLTPADIGLAAAHATGTPDNDAAEAAALHTLFGDRLPDVPVVAFKGHLGHTLGGAGAIELIFSALALRDGVLPPTVLDANETVEFDGLCLTRGVPQAATIRATLNTSLGFGGANTAIVLTPPDEAAVATVVADAPKSTVVVTGIGLVLPGVYDRATLVDLPPRAAGPIDMARVEASLNARRVRRMSDYVKLTLAAVAMATRDAFGDAPLPTDTAAVLGTTHGSADFSEQYYRGLIRDGATAANPILFAEGVPNAAAAQLSLMLNLTGPCQTIIGTATAGLDALRLAMLRVQSGAWDRAIVSAGEENSRIVAAAYERCAGASANDTAGAAAIVIESADSAAARGATVLATLTHADAATGNDLRPLARLLRSMPPSDRTIAVGGHVRPVATSVDAPPEPVAPLGVADGRFSVTALAAVVASIARGDGRSLAVAAIDRAGGITTVRAVTETHDVSATCTL